LKKELTNSNYISLEIIGTNVFVAFQSAAAMLRILEFC